MSEATITGLFTVVVTVILILERVSNKKRDAKQDEESKKNDRLQTYNAVNNCIRLKIESGKDNVDREHRDLNKLTAMKVGKELINGKPINGELKTQRIATQDAEKVFYAQKDELMKKQMQLLDDYMSGKEIEKENYL